jgi:putative SbcD/Mre11-related phosphoesterase
MIKKDKQNLTERYIFIEKTLFFPKEKILVIGDIHLGFDNLLKKAGIPIYLKQIDETKNEILKIIEKIKSKNFEIKKIIFLGDLKHSFSYNFLEKKYLKDFFEFLKKNLNLNHQNIILIRGNHDTFNYFDDIKLKNYFKYNNLLFVHGDKQFKILNNKKIKFVIMGHIHPSLTLIDKIGIKKENFKCFLKGKIHSKIFIVVPSFLNASKGFDFLDFEKYQDSFSILQGKFLKNFEIYLIGEKEILNFGKINELYGD